MELNIFAFRKLGISLILVTIAAAAVCGCTDNKNVGDIFVGDTGTPGDLHDSTGETLSDVTHDAHDASRDTFPDTIQETVEDTGDVPDGACYSTQGVLDSDCDGLADPDETAMGTDPNNPDSDSDGVNDGDEVTDGTDPADPSSARAWQPSLTARPRLFLDADDIAEMARRMDETDQVYASLAARIRKVADTRLPEHPENGYELRVDKVRGQVAESAAFIGLVKNDETMLDRAIDAITAGYIDPNTADLAMDSDYDLLGAEALTAYCSAWDFLAASPSLEKSELELVRQSIVKRIDDFRYLVEQGPLLPMILFARNNHVLKVWSAFALCAVSINDRPEAAYDLSAAMTGMEWVLNGYQLTPDGGNAEGYHYLAYGSDNYLPFFWAWHRWADGASLPFKAVPTTQPDNPLAGQIVQVGDFAVNPVTRAAYRLAIDSAVPTGVCAPVDDANGAAQHGAILAAMLGDRDFLFNWFLSGVNNKSSPLHTLSLIAWDGSEPPVTSSGTLDFVKYRAGMAILRESWKEDALYLYLCGEHGPIRENGLGHEHPDELSFLVWDDGLPLIIDPGYINYENHSKVFRPRDHNTILVDGSGSNFDSMSELGIGVGNDAFLSCLDKSGDYTWTAVTTGYENVGFQRRIVRVRQDFFIVEDMLNADDPHEYTFLMNGMGGGTTPDSDFELTPGGAIWMNGQAAVEVTVVPLSGTAAISSVLQEHNAPSWGEWHTHEQLLVKATMPADSAGFISVVIPAENIDALPVVVVNHYEGAASLEITCPGMNPETFVSAARDMELELAGGIIVNLERGLNVFVPDEEGLDKVLHIPVLEPADAEAPCPGEEAV